MADEFYLKQDRTGKTYRPFDTKAGAKVVIGSTVYTVVQKSDTSPATQSSVEKKLASITIPKADFRFAQLADVVEFLKQTVKEKDPQKIGVNFVLNATKKTNGDFSMDESEMVTLSLSNASALDILKAVTEQTKHKYKISGNIVTIYRDK